MWCQTDVYVVGVLMILFGLTALLLVAERRVRIRMARLQGRIEILEELRQHIESVTGSDGPTTKTARERIEDASDPLNEVCYAQSPTGARCFKSDGHDGEHKASRVEGDPETWTDDETE